MVTINANAARELVALSQSQAVEGWLKREVDESVLTDDSFWRPVGGLRSNAGSIEASADEINPLVERIINGIEAVVELRVADEISLPQSPREAVEALFGIERGKSRFLTEPSHDLTRLIEMVFRGSRSKPTIVVRDQGIGVHPNDFDKTIVSLQQSDKGQKPYLVGMYGQGGSSTFDKCDYTVIVSRRHPDHLAAGQTDGIGWTVVRRRLVTRAHVYSYLVDPSTARVPIFSPTFAEQIGLDHGTYVAHIGYRNLGSFASQELTNNAFFTLNFRLFDPLIPWTLIEEREGLNRTSRTMRGVPYRLDRHPESSGVGTASFARSGDPISVRHHAVYTHDEPGMGHLSVEWWVLQDEEVRDGRKRMKHDERTNAYRDRTRRYARRSMTITRGGQIHAALTPRIFEQHRLRQIARSIVVQVDTDDLTFEGGAGFFQSNRADLKVSSQEAIERALDAAIEIYADELRGIERERQNEIVRGRGASDEGAIKQRLDRLISQFRTFQPAAGSGSNGNRHSEQRFKGLANPTFLRWARSETIRVTPGARTHSDLLTDAADDTIRDSRSELRVIPSSPWISASVVGGGSGRWRVALECSSDVAVGENCRVRGTFEMPGIWLETAPVLGVEVAPAPPPYEGNDPPTFIRFRSNDNDEVHIRQGGARVALETDAKDDLFDTAVLSIQPPIGINLRGRSNPRQGEVRVNLEVLRDFPLGEAGPIYAELRLANGQVLRDQASLLVDARREPSGSVARTPVPDYRIIDVREVPVSESDNQWSEMPTILDSSGPWNSGDVGAYTLGIGAENGDSRQIVFYLNADNEAVRQAERRITERRSERTIESVRQYHRTLVCYYLYQMATVELASNGARGGSLPSQEETDESRFRYQRYRDELIRLNRTLLYAQREFFEALETPVFAEDA